MAGEISAAASNAPVSVALQADTSQWSKAMDAAAASAQKMAAQTESRFAKLKASVDEKSKALA